MTSKLALTLALSAATALMSPAAELVVNGGFETGDFTGWTVSGNTSNSKVDPNFAYTGNFGAKWGPQGSDGFLSQTLPTVAGQPYTLTYALENLNGVPNDFGVFWGGVLVPGSDFVDAGPFPGTVFSFTLTAPGPDTVLQFYFRQDPAFWGLDDVSVQGAVTPEPASMALAALGLLAVTGLRKFRQ